MTTVSFITLDNNDRQLNIQLEKAFNLLDDQEVENVVETIRKLHGEVSNPKVSAKKRFSNFDESALVTHPDYDTLKNLSLQHAGEVLVELNFARTTLVNGRIALGDIVVELSPTLWTSNGKSGVDTPSLLNYVQQNVFPHLSLSQIYKLVAKTWEENNY